MAGQWFAGIRARDFVLYLDAVVANAERDRRAAEERRSSSSSSRSGGAISGSCAAMMPAGFDPAIVQRESGGDPTADNGTHKGCAQIADSHFAPGGYCAGNDYATCWRRLKEGADAGQFPDPWACTPESGCG